MKPQAMAVQLKDIYDEHLVSVLLYGSAVGSDFSRTFSDYNLLVVLTTVTAGELARANRAVRAWVRAGNPAPLFFPVEQFRTAADVFPIEFLDMQSRHDVLIGINPLAGIAIDLSNLRHQCESELRGKILYLRNFYAQHAHRPRRVAHEMVATFPAFAAVFRGALQLVGETPGANMKLVIEQLATKIGFQPEPFLDLISIREGTHRSPRGDDALATFERYLTELEAITKFIDAFQTEGGQTS